MVLIHYLLTENMLKSCIIIEKHCVCWAENNLVNQNASKNYQGPISIQNIN
jgi:hypothetical protein